MGLFLVNRGGVCANAWCAAGGVVVGRGAAGRGEGAARRPSGDREAVVGSGPVGADRGALAARSRRVRPLSRRSWATDDIDADLRALDGGQAAHRLGLRDARAGGVGLAAPAALLPDRSGRAGAGRVDGAKAHQAAGIRDRRRADQGGDREGSQGAALSAAGGADRFDGDRGGRALPDGLRPRVAGRALARAGGSGSPRRRCAIARARSDAGCGRSVARWAGAPAGRRSS